MIKNSIVLIPNISHDKQICDYLQQTANILTQHDNKVFIIYHSHSFSIKEIVIKIITKQKLIISKKTNNIYYLYPIHLIPFKRIKLIQNINAIIYSVFIQLILKIRYFNANNHLFWTFFPQLVQLIKIKLPFWKIIYDIVDFHTSPDHQKQKQLTNYKKLLLAKSDYIFANSHSLKNKYRLLTNKPIVVVPQGFSHDDFLNEDQKTKIKIKKNKSIIGFVGQISQRLDFNLLKKLVSQNQQWDFIFIGPKHHEANISLNRKLAFFDRIIKFSNCFWYQAQPRNQLAPIVEQFDVCMIPYDINYDFNRYCYPMKIFEYFYMSKPVISTPIEELKHKKFKHLIKIGNTAEEWEVHIKNLLKKPWSQHNKHLQKQMAISNSWENKIEAISQIIDGKIQE